MAEIGEVSGQSDFQNITEGLNLSILNLGANTLYHLVS